MMCITLYRLLFNHFYKWLIPVCVLFFSKIHAQVKDSSAHQLGDITISAQKQSYLQQSKKRIEIDSITMVRYSTSSLAELLSNESSIHIKSYGNGNIATTAMRGGNANHTAVVWNGLNIQNPMLGQSDLSILPALVFDNVSLDYGGSSAMWGSGALGGSIQLQNKTLFNQGLKTKLQMSYGSFNSKKIASSTTLSFKKFISNTRVYYNSSDNNYKYKDTTDKENPNKQLTHANFVGKGLLQEFYILPFTNHKIGIRAWYHHSFRNLPSYTSTVSKQHQVDENIRLNADWSFAKKQLQTVVRLGYLTDVIDYTDSMAGTFSESKVNTLIAESDNVYTINNHSFNVGANYTSYTAHTKNYDGVHTLQKAAVFAAYKLSLLQTKFNYHLSVRKEFTSLTHIPFTGQTGISYKLNKFFTAKVNGSRSYRQPSLNDLYWNPGGNPDLKPEDSYEYDGSIEFRYSKNYFSLAIEGTYFNRHTTNWIIWLPTDKAYWSPQNIAEVHSRGSETKTEIAYAKKDLLIKFTVNTAYTLSTNEKAGSENDNSLGRQLIYTPRYNGQGTLVLKYQGISILFNQSYTGYRFTSTDNTSWLNPYYAANLKLAWAYSFSSVNAEIFGSINNLFNKNYVVVANRPMPLRTIEGGITLQYHKKQKHNK